MLLGKNRPEGWVGTDRKWVRNVLAWVQIVWVRKIHGYETTVYRELEMESLGWVHGGEQGGGQLAIGAKSVSFHKIQRHIEFIISAYRVSCSPFQY